MSGGERLTKNRVFVKIHSFFFIRTSNFDAEAERSYIFWRFEAETFLKMFLNLPGSDTRFLKKDLMALKLF